MKIAALTFVSLALAAAARAQSPYAGEEARPIKALSEADVKALLEGTGMGLAKAAELHQYPGPRHVLDNAEALGLSQSQRAAVDAAFQKMKAQAIPLGQEIVDAERQLDAVFAQRYADTAGVARLTREIAERQGRLRAVHLSAHVVARELLTPAQIEKYVALRGYEHGAHEGHPGR